MADNQQVSSQEDKDSEDNKELLGKVKAAITVFQHKNGRVPSLEEMNELLTQEDPVPENKDDSTVNSSQSANSEPEFPTAGTEQDDSPRCLSFVVLHGKDPSKPAFFSDPVAGHFDVSSGEWIKELPDLAQHLQQRDVQGEDIFSMILHGIMSDDDYEKLSKAGMIDDHSAAMKAKIDRMREAHSTLEKSINEFTGDSRPEANMDFEDKEGDALSTFGLMSDDVSEEDADMPGENVLEQIFAGVLESGASPSLLKMIDAAVAKALGGSAPSEDASQEIIEKSSAEPNKSAKVAILN